VHRNQFRSANDLPQLRSWLRPGATRKIILGLLAATLAIGAAAPAFAGKPGNGRQGDRHEPQHELSVAGKHHGKSKTITKTFANGEAIAIPAEGADDAFGPADPYPSAIDVTGFKKGKIADLNLTLRGFSHTFTRDVDVLLVAPDGRNLVVMGDVGGLGDSEGATDLTITLDDEAATPLPVGNDEALTSGSFQPLDQFGLSDTDEPDLIDFPAPAPAPSGDLALSTFDGSNPNGQWQLFVLDDTHEDAGSLSDGWTLQITATTKAKKHPH
jgi:subtilisin-like proprotein convertase family protein